MSARQAPVTRPTYPVPTIVRFMNYTSRLNGSVNAERVAFLCYVGGAQRSVRVAADEALPERQADDLQIEPEAPVLHVVQIELHAAHHLFDAVGFAAITVDLRPAGDAGLDPVAVH